MKRIYHPYWKWEDWKNGLYKSTMNVSEVEEESMVKDAKDLLCDKNEFYLIAYKVINEWKYSAEENLSNKNRNRQAWIGQASVCYKFGYPEYVTKYAWRLMTDIERLDANIIADEIIRLWENRNVIKKISEY